MDGAYLDAADRDLNIGSRLRLSRYWTRRLRDRGGRAWNGRGGFRDLPGQLTLDGLFLTHDRLVYDEGLTPDERFISNDSLADGSLRSRCFTDPFDGMENFRLGRLGWKWGRHLACGGLVARLSGTEVPRGLKSAPHRLSIRECCGGFAL
jgi:hypothetical protein